ncbi:hypothetical protein [Micromonospora ureilytica]|uniref:Uncharacterized protein n=1 Tax=Micromonospora ureilytica TaxID=709868 RepID=A0ABS0JSN6_9ACTN|nr:hypothetical protein [Micromonospora ureilytica]MBG6070054.1 hypothetical protein [Micromonospora ureilytica]
MNPPADHPTWCDRDRCDRFRTHVSPVVHVDTNRTEETVMDVALIKPWTPVTDPQVSLTVTAGPTVDQVVMSLGQARALAYRLRELLAAAGEGPR